MLKVLSHTRTHSQYPWCYYVGFVWVLPIDCLLRDKGGAQGMKKVSMTWGHFLQSWWQRAELPARFKASYNLLHYVSEGMNFGDCRD